MANKRRTEISSESMALSAVAAVGIVSAAAFLWRIGLPEWLVAILALLVAMLLHHALDRKLRTVEKRRSSAPPVSERK